VKKGDVVQCPYGRGDCLDFYDANIIRHGKSRGQPGIWVKFLDSNPKSEQFFPYDTEVKVTLRPEDDSDISADDDSDENFTLDDPDISADDDSDDEKKKKKTRGKKKSAARTVEAMGRKKRTMRREETPGTDGATGAKEVTSEEDTLGTDEATPGTNGATGAKEVTVENSSTPSKKIKLPPPISPANKWEYFEPSGYHVLSGTHWICYPAGYLLGGRKTVCPVYHNSVLNMKTAEKPSLFEEGLNM